ncbi:hypothetical protein PTKIN_Ptkin18bG0051400 [Pterospermum kingtungense]
MNSYALVLLWTKSDRLQKGWQSPLTSGCFMGRSFVDCFSSTNFTLPFRKKQDWCQRTTGLWKATLVFALDYLFRITGRKSATLSIDDFYLTAEGQVILWSLCIC